MTTKLKFMMISAVTLGLAGSFNGCTCNADAEMGNAKPTTPAAPPPPAPPPPPPAPPPVAAAPTPAPVKIMPVGKAKIEGNKVSIPGELEFDLDKATIKDTQQSKDILNTLADFMKQNPQVTKLRVEGHTDNQGSADHNMKLSQERADAVKAWLSSHGVDASRLTTQGYGQTHPLVENDNAEHKAMNRRTEFHIAEIDGKPADAGGSPAMGPSNPTSTTGSSTVPTPGAASAPSTTNKTNEKKGSAGAPAHK